jgi:dihydropteroate synthase
MTPTAERRRLWWELLHGGDAGPRLMAIVNASPESFYAGSVSRGRQAVRDTCLRLVEEGADVIDIGAMSTAPYKETRVSVEEERVRMIEAVSAAREVCDLPLTADTMRPAVARAALDAGADGINDVTGLHGDAGMARVVAERGCGLILMANGMQLGESLPGEEPVSATRQCLEKCLAQAEGAGIAREMICVDPGIGFFRGRTIPWYQWDLALLRGLGDFAALGFPLMVSASRKSFLGELLKRPNADDRLAGSLAVALDAARRGARLIRTHDVAATRDALVMDGMLRNG